MAQGWELYQESHKERKGCQFQGHEFQDYDNLRWKEQDLFLGRRSMR